MPTVLIVEDQERVGAALALLLDLHGLPTVTVRSPEEALAEIERHPFDLVLQDMNFSPGAVSGEEGAELFRELRRRDPELPVLLVTAWASLETAVQLIREGAGDYVEKPWDDDKLVARIRQLLRLRELEGENRRLKLDRQRSREELASRFDLTGLVYVSAAMHEVVSLAVRVARADAPVLITGPNGSGKERIADLLHANSARRGRPFVKVHAGALPETLLEAELFGAEAGAYTGATKRRIGRFEAADGGTLLLDEIGTLPLEGQVKLLRVLQTGEMERLGSSETRRVDVRVVAATNHDLPAAIAAGGFREDLYYRLNVIELAVPPLVDRRDDIVPLAEHFLAEHRESSGRPLELASGARAALLLHSWPGNVRELANRIRRSSLLVSDDRIEAADLDLAPGDSRSPAGRTSAPMLEEGTAGGERQRIEQALVRHQGVISQAAEELGLSRQALYRSMHRLGIVLERRLRH